MRFLIIFQFLIICNGALFGQCHPDDYKGLKALFDNTQMLVWLTGYEGYIGDWPNTTGWDVANEQPPANCDLSTWFGITLDGNGRVSEINIPNNNISGFIPTEIGLLTELVRIDLSDNRITGFIPEELGSLTKLEYLDLSMNGIASVPFYIFENHTNIKEVDFSDNNLQNHPYDFQQLVQLPQIERVDLSMNQIIGDLYEDFVELVSPNIQELNLSQNMITGCYEDSWYINNNAAKINLNQNDLCEDWDKYLLNGLPTFDNTSIEVYDKWWRNISDKSIDLIDWEGHIHNPENKIRIVPPASMQHPLVVNISSSETSLLYVLSSSGGANGSYTPTGFTAAHYSNTLIASFFLGVQPDRNYDDEEYNITIEVIDAMGEVATTTQVVRVIDQDYNRSNVFEPVLNFDVDSFFNFYTEIPIAKDLTIKAVEDVAYFFDDQGFDTIQANEYQVDLTIDFTIGEEVSEYFSNSVPYNTYYFFFTGNDGLYASGGPGSDTEAKINGMPVGIASMGRVQMETLNDLGGGTVSPEFFYSDDDNLWWQGNIYLGGCIANPNCQVSQIDYYGTMHHELTHLLGSEYTFKKYGASVGESFTITGESFRKYTGRPYLRHGDYGGHVGLVQPTCRRQNGVDLMDRSYLSLFEAVGWKLRETGPLMHVRIEEANLPDGSITEGYVGHVTANYGIPSYNYTISQGSLPAGLELNSFTGQVSGFPTQLGSFTFTIKVEDNDVDNQYNPNGVAQEFTINIVEDNPNCQDQLALQGDITGSGTYSAEENVGVISSDQIIKTSSNVIYRAGGYIEFEYDFEVELGAIFQTYIDGCVQE